jgi:hypothetical protein
MHSRFRLAITLVMLYCALLTEAATQGTAAKPVSNRLGYAIDSRLLIIEAEDLGMAHSVDKATFEALDKGWVTSASVLTSAPWFPEVALWANQHRQADLGVQLDLTSDWKNYCWRAVCRRKLPDRRCSTAQDTFR